MYGFYWKLEYSIERSMSKKKNNVAHKQKGKEFRTGILPGMRD